MEQQESKTSLLKWTCPKASFKLTWNGISIRLFQKEVSIEVMPKAISSAQDTLIRIENNMNRLDRFLGLVMDKLENDMADEERDFDIREMDTAIKLHREVRETLGDLAKWIEKTADVDKQQSVSIIGVLQDVFSQRPPKNGER